MHAWRCTRISGHEYRLMSRDYQLAAGKLSGESETYSIDYACIGNNTHFAFIEKAGFNLHR